MRRTLTMAQCSMLPHRPPLHAWSRGGRLQLLICMVACVLGFAWWSPARAQNAAHQRPDVLILLSYHPGHSWEDRILAGINEWQGNGESRPIFHTEWLDSKRLPGPAQYDNVLNYLTQKYIDKRFDLVLTVDDNALAFVARNPQIFGNPPVVFSGINGSPGDLIGNMTEVTGILERFDLSRTLHTALSLHPGTRRLVFVTPEDDVGVSMRNDINTVMALEPAGPIVEHWITPELLAIKDRLKEKTQETLLFVLGAIPARKGFPPLEPEEAVSFVRAATDLPVYTDLDTSVGKGAVGGYMNSGIETGRLQAAMAQKVLSGIAPSQIPYVRKTPLALVFDYLELQRLGLSKQDLPSGSAFINEPASIFDSKYRKPLIIFSVIIATLIACLAALVIRSRVLADRQRALRYQATHDDLTGLPNRHELPQLFRQFDRTAEREPVALVMLGLNRFKLLNSTYGHAFGDTVVRAVADRLKDWCSRHEALSRFGGDSFVIVSRLGDDGALNDLCTRCEDLFSTPLSINGQHISVSAAFGISIANPPQINLENMLRKADTAMYEAKRSGNTHVVTFDRCLFERSARQFQIESALPDAIAKGDIEIYYQPIIDTQRGCIAGFEALSRWKHSELGMIPPPEFILAATDSGHISKLTQYVLRQSCEAFRPHLANPECPYLGVNISVSDIYTGDLPNRLAEILKETGMPASRLILEVTEDMLLHDENSAIEVLAQIRSQGVRIAIDDFGTGYSSMGYLSKYQVHLIKIDRSFVQNIATSSQDQKIVRAISSMARDLELSIITEGVETTEQSDLLRKMGCLLQQGYLFGKPQPAAQWAVNANRAPAGRATQSVH